MTAVRLESLCLPAQSAASHTEPSLISPSPITTITRLSRFSMRAASAMPTPTERPWPSAPVEASTPAIFAASGWPRSEEHTSELQSHSDLVCRLLLEKKKKQKNVILKEKKTSRIGRRKLRQ